MPPRKNALICRRSVGAFGAGRSESPGLSGPSGVRGGSRQLDARCLCAAQAVVNSPRQRYLK